MPKIAHDDLVSTAEAAQMLHRHVRSIHRLVKSGGLTPVTKIRGRTGSYIFLRSDIERLLKDAS